MDIIIINDVIIIFLNEVVKGIYSFYGLVVRVLVL